MADDTKGSGPVHHRHIRHLVPAPDGSHRPSPSGRVYRHARDSGSNKYLLATETGWRTVSAAFSLGAVAGATYFILWYEVIK